MLNAIWEHVYGERLKYPNPRYKDVIIADPKRFNWLPVRGADRVDRKFLGSFSERGMWVTPPLAEAGGFSLCRGGVAADQPGP